MDWNLNWPISEVLVLNQSPISVIPLIVRNLISQKTVLSNWGPPVCIWISIKESFSRGQWIYQHFLKWIFTMENYDINDFLVITWEKCNDSPIFAQTVTVFSGSIWILMSNFWNQNSIEFSNILHNIFNLVK